MSKEYIKCNQIDISLYERGIWIGEEPAQYRIENILAPQIHEDEVYKIDVSVGPNREHTHYIIEVSDRKHIRKKVI